MATEYRVWQETGDLVGCATITRAHGWHTVTVDPFESSESRKPRGFRNSGAAEQYAQEAAERWMVQAIAWETKERGEPPVGVLSEHGYSIQVVED